MSILPRCEPSGVRPTYPEGTIQECLGGESHWGNFHSNYYDLMLWFINIQTFLSDVAHHKNGGIVQMMNDNYIDCLGMSEMNTYWPAHSIQHIIQERTKGWFKTMFSAAAHNRHNTKIL